MRRPSSPHVLALVTPALADANNGNWQTARRWAGFLRAHLRVQLMQHWEAGDESLMIALHARRSAPSIAAWRRLYPTRPLVVVLTGTDLYRDISEDVAAQQSLELADRLVVLNELGARALPEAHRAKAVVCLQSCRRWRPRRRPQTPLRVLMVGHLRDEKSPRTYFEAVRLLAHRTDLVFEHIGGGLDPVLADEARALALAQPSYRWLGAMPHALTREHIANAHVLVHPSRMEGGAHVVIEAIQSGTPVLASAIDGNLGLLGSDYPATFAWDDARALADWLVRACDDATMLPGLREHLARRADCFEPAHERQTLLDLVRSLS